MRGDLSLPTTGPRLVELMKLMEPQDAGKLAQLLRSSQRRPAKSMQGSRFPMKAKQYTSPYPELRGRM